MFNSFDTNISTEEYYSRLYSSWEADCDERREKNKQTSEEVTRGIGAMASF